MEASWLVGAVVSLVVAAFFSGVEMAFSAANKLHLELQGKQKRLTGAGLAYLSGRQAQLMGTTLVGYTLALIVFGVCATRLGYPLVAHLLPDFLLRDAIALLVVMLLATALVSTLAEFLPKTLFAFDPDGALKFFLIPLLVSYFVLFPLVHPILGAARWFTTKVLRLPFAEDRPAFRLTDLQQYLSNLNRKEPDEELAEVDTRIFHNALDFKTVRVRDCLVPRTELTAVELNTPMENVRRTFVESGHSKVLVYQETIDNVIGYCHALELFKKPQRVADILTPILVVPETMLANELLVKFTNERKSLALVADEFGGTSGLVSMEDVMEKIFGEIQDEHDGSEDWVEQQLDEYTFVLSARQEVDYLNTKYGWDIPLGDYDTIGGFVTTVNEDLPRLHDVISHGSFTFTILSMHNNRIDTVKLTVTDAA